MDWKESSEKMKLIYKKVRNYLVCLPRLPKPQEGDKDESVPIHREDIPKKKKSSVDVRMRPNCEDGTLRIQQIWVQLGLIAKLIPA